jgi:hypothetical protein
VHYDNLCKSKVTPVERAFVSVKNGNAVVLLADKTIKQKVAK